MVPNGSKWIVHVLKQSKCDSFASHPVRRDILLRSKKEGESTATTYKHKFRRDLTTSSPSSHSEVSFIFKFYDFQEHSWRSAPKIQFLNSIPERLRYLSWSDLLILVCLQAESHWWDLHSQTSKHPEIELGRLKHLIGIPARRRKGLQSSQYDHRHDALQQLCHRESDQGHSDCQRMIKKKSQIAGDSIDPSNSTKLWERIWKWCHTFEKGYKGYYGIHSRGRSGTEYDVFTAISCQRSQLQRTLRASYGLTSSISNRSKNSPERVSRRATAQDFWWEGQTIGGHQTDIRMRTPS